MCTLQHLSSVSEALITENLGYYAAPLNSSMNQELFEKHFCNHGI